MSAREIRAEDITRAVAELCVEACCFLPEDIEDSIKNARERSELGRAIIEDMLLNARIARQERLPICQDTGMAVVFCELGQDAHIAGGFFDDAVNEGVRLGYTEGALRLSIVKDPFRRENTGDNTPAVIHLRLVKGDGLRITVAPKGFGSENMSAVRMFNPTASTRDIEDFVVETVGRAGSNPCPPVIVGVGLGGNFESCALMAKRALCLPLGSCADPFYADMERRLLDRINGLGIGPQGFGGDVTALGVSIIASPTHIAGLPCAVNIGCHVTRHASREL